MTETRYVQIRRGLKFHIAHTFETTWARQPATLPRSSAICGRLGSPGWATITTERPPGDYDVCSTCLDTAIQLDWLPEKTGNR